MHTHDDDLDQLPEGEEKAPPLMHTMSIVRWVILIGISLFAVAMLLTYFDLAPWSTHEQAAQQYHCPMHPTYVSNQPGDCPICGMSLVPIADNNNTAADSESNEMMHDKTATAAKQGQYTCPMHPEIVSDTAGRCPDCGMFLEQVEAATKMTYVCPMHPEVVSDTPSECPKCGMSLEPVESSSETESEEMSMTSAVSGLAPIALEPERLQLIGLKTETAAIRRFGGSRRFPGYVVPDETRTVNINSRVRGWVQELFVNQTGQAVEKGDTLFLLYSQELYQAEQDFLTALISSRKADYDKFLADRRKELLDAARERMRLMGLAEEEITRLEKSEKATAELPILSPVSGLVLNKNLLAGEAIMPEQTLFTIADLTRIWVEVDVFESDLAGIEVGQDALLSLAAFPGDQFHGQVVFLYPALNEQTRSLKARLQFQNPLLRLKPGMFADVTLAGGDQSLLAVSREAVMQDGARNYVFVMHHENHFTPRLVTTGRMSDDWIEIRSGLAAGEQVVTSANFLIDSESRLKAAIAGMGSDAAPEHSGHGM